MCIMNGGGRRKVHRWRGEWSVYMLAGRLIIGVWRCSTRRQRCLIDSWEQNACLEDGRWYVSVEGSIRSTERYDWSIQPHLGVIVYIVHLLTPLSFPHSNFHVNDPATVKRAELPSYLTVSVNYMLLMSLGSRLGMASGLVWQVACTSLKLHITRI